MSKIVALSGGGIKAAVAAATVRDQGTITLLHVDFGQPTVDAEVKALYTVAGALGGAGVETINLPHIRRMASSPLDAEGGAEAAHGYPPPPVARGLLPLLASVGGHWAMRHGIETLVMGITQVFRDSPVGLPLADAEPHRRREFVQTFNMAMEAATAERHVVRLHTPLIDVGYSDAVRLAVRFQIPLDGTWSCTRDALQPCGRCGGCRGRARAFAEAQVYDSLGEAAATAAGAPADDRRP